MSGRTGGSGSRGDSRPRGGAKPVLDAIQARIVGKQYGEALADLQVILRDEPDNTDALYMSAVCRRYRREFHAALAQLARLKALSAEDGRAHQGEGPAYRDLGRPEHALRAYAQACRFNPALVASWRGQLNILARSGRVQEAAQARAQLNYLKRLPQPLVIALDLMSQGKLLKAEDLCRKFLRKAPHHVEAMRLLADIGIRFGVLADAEFLLESAHQFEPTNVRVHM
ncbi:MAG: tetratricopeptide repeat protein, partial [Gammaproteobacteria bacterium]|nr:tetratricopeptide repeat protein [Gammaproteobacteria bacterium]